MRVSKQMRKLNSTPVFNLKFCIIIVIVIDIVIYYRQCCCGGSNKSSLCYSFFFSCVNLFLFSYSITEFDFLPWLGFCCLVPRVNKCLLPVGGGVHNCNNTITTTKRHPLSVSITVIGHFYVTRSLSQRRRMFQPHQI